MSSSVFIESSSVPAATEFASTSDSNLVVVYGKNGISFDDKGLENLIEEKQISSISVIRITSPTPSMEEEEDEEAKLEEMFRRQQLQSGESSCEDEKDDNEVSGGEKSDEKVGRNESSACYDEPKSEQLTEGSNNDSDDEAISRKSKPFRNQSTASKQKRQSRNRNRTRPEIVGLRLEEFYPPEDAHQIIKEALKMAGLGPDRKSKEDLEFQLFIIRNDHCYTPYTSPSQMKAKLAAEKLEIEKQGGSRKVIGSYQNIGGGKQLFVRKKTSQIQESTSTKSGAVISTDGEKYKPALVNRTKKDYKEFRFKVDAACSEDDNALSSNDDMQDDNNESALSAEESGDTDNDRDSDLDFDVNNPKGKRRKFKSPKNIKRNSLIVSKQNLKPKRLQSQEEQGENVKQPPSTTNISRPECSLKITSDSDRLSIRSTPSKIPQSIETGLAASSCLSKALSPIISALPTIPRKAYENKCISSTVSNFSSKTQHKAYTVKGSGQINTSPPPHREILINKQIMSSPKTKGFTELSTLIDRNEIKDSTGFIEAQKKLNTELSTTAAVGEKTTPSQKGFMPIGLETAATNQLPVQISIQTHQSSSELEAEHDKQLDLINSIVQDELKKSNEVVTVETNINKNIPELVKMLESTEKVLEKSNIHQKGESVEANMNDNRLCVNPSMYSTETSRTTDGAIADIDINNASLLATPHGDDELPDDILQLVDMIHDDKSLQEVVNVLGTGDCSDAVSNVGNTVTNPKLPPLTLISHENSAQKANILEDVPHSSKSIIQLSISNLPVQTVKQNQSLISTCTPVSKLVRSEPRQVVRGNGRVITLPPIEAPTTRAKRRAQVQPHSITQNTIIGPSSTQGIPINTNESSMDNSVQLNISANSTSSVVPEKKAQESVNRRRGSKENTVCGSVGNQKTKAKSNAAKKVKNKPQSEVDASESGNEDDDDPNKLWCICRQPHNNRFMICCDACEDWFHGTCVSITKAMGLEMEQKGVDWTCPKCVKKQEEKKQPRITDLLVKKTDEVNAFSNAGSFSVTPKANVTIVHKAAQDGNVSEEKKHYSHKPIMQTKEITQTVIDAAKTKLQPGQFINLKDLSSAGKKVIFQAGANNSSGQKSLFVTTQSLRTASTAKVTPIRTIAVVKHMPGQGNQIHPHQSIKVIRTISPAKSSTQFVTTTASGNISKSVIAVDPSTFCIVCKKPARINTIYCSDDCIRKHAQNAVHTFMVKSQSENETTLVSNTLDEKVKKKQKGLFEDLLSMADRKPKVERVNVYERKSGRILTVSNAPTVSNLKKWLQENPTFEVVQPGSVQAQDIEKKKLRAHHSSSPIVTPKAATSPPPLKFLPLLNPVPQKGNVSRSNSPQTPVGLALQQNLTFQSKTNKNVLDFPKSSSPSITSRPGTPKQLPKYSQHVSIKTEKNTKTSEDSKAVKEKTISLKKPLSAESSSSKPINNDGEPIRLLVRRTLKEQLLLRTKEEDGSISNFNSACNTNELDFPKLSPEEIDDFANATELEMYKYFNRDTGIKYKAKYRSLIFNIKDRKNHTLFAKICRKQIEPKQLIRMTPDEMASQELSQWRKQENKHQLEMIKKSELDLLACAKNYVLKTHKGEEVIENKSAEYENVDLAIPVEDVVTALNKTDFVQVPSITKSQSNWIDADSTLLPITCTSDSKDKDKERDRDKERHRDRNHNSREGERRHKSKDRNREKSRSRKRSRSHSRSRSRERSGKRHKSSHKDEKRDRDKERSKDRSDRDQPCESRLNDRKIEKKSANISKTRETTKKHHHNESHSKSLDTYNLIDQILESTKTVEEAANLTLDRDRDVENIIKPYETSTATQSISSSTSKDNADSFVVDIPVPPNFAESDQEPTSTVSIPTPPHDPYARFITMNSPTFDDTNRYNMSTLWTGDINMVDVASFQLSIQSVVGNCIGISKLLATELDIVGRIGPETVWDYISKIKKSPNKEIVIVRLLPASESETSAYKILYEYLDKRNRLGVVKSVSPFIKDFYIYPLDSRKEMPLVLRPGDPVDFYDDPHRPDMLIGIIIRVVGKRQHLIGKTKPVATSNSTAMSCKLVNRKIELDSSLSPPGSPNIKKRRQSIATNEIDVDAIIKAPIISKSQKVLPSAFPSAVVLTDADEPYSPGGSSDDDLPLLPLKIPSSSNQMQTAEDELKRKMEDINRQIAAQEMEIAGLLTGETSKFGSNSSKTSKVLANIAIPSNLSQILASIKPAMISQDELPTVPPPPPLIGSLISTSTSSGAIAVHDLYKSECGSSVQADTPSRLANLSEAELLSMVPDNIAIIPKLPPVDRYDEPPPPGV